MVVLIAAATLQMLLSGRQLAVMQHERELAFRAAEAALRDGEAELLAAAASPNLQDRLALWPAPGRCGSGQQAGLCRPALAGPPVWQPWLRADAEVDVIGVPLGRFTGAALPADAAAQEPPRYVAEILDEAPAGYSAPDPAFALAPAPRMRVTAVGFGRTRAVRALLQSVIQP
nr:pilus assembly protein [Cupriavidus sp. WGlv3]